MPPASFGGNAQGSSGSSGDPADASGAFRPGLRALTEEVKLLFQSPKVIRICSYPCGRKRFSRRELLTTDTELMAMAAEAIMGFKRIPQKG